MVWLPPRTLTASLSCRAASRRRRHPGSTRDPLRVHHGVVDPAPPRTARPRVGSESGSDLAQGSGCPGASQVRQAPGHTGHIAPPLPAPHVRSGRPQRLPEPPPRSRAGKAPSGSRSGSRTAPSTGASSPAVKALGTTAPEKPETVSVFDSTEGAVSGSASRACAAASTAPARRSASRAPRTPLAAVTSSAVNPARASVRSPVCARRRGAPCGVSGTPP